jgi:acyl dehydratase
MTVSAHGLDEIRALAGKDLGCTGWLAITQDRVDTFAGAVDDHDGSYLTLSLIVPLTSELLDVQGVRMTVNYGLERVRFPAPVRVGSKIRLAARVVSVEDVSRRVVEMRVDGTLELDGSDAPACVAQALYRHYG